MTIIFQIEFMRIALKKGITQHIKGEQENGEALPSNKEENYRGFKRRQQSDDPPTHQNVDIKTTVEAFHSATPNYAKVVIGKLLQEYGAAQKAKIGTRNTKKSQNQVGGGCGGGGEHKKIDCIKVPSSTRESLPFETSFVVEMVATKPVADQRADTKVIPFNLYEEIWKGLDNIKTTGFNQHHVYKAMSGDISMKCTKTIPQMLSYKSTMGIVYISKKYFERCHKKTFHAQFSAGVS